MEEMTLRDTLLAFGEWLDTGRACYNKDHESPGSKELTHEQVADAFIMWWEVGESGRAPLPGRGSQLDKITVTVSDGVFADGDLMIAIRGTHGRWYGRGIKHEDLKL